MQYKNNSKIFNYDNYALHFTIPYLHNIIQIINFYLRPT